VGPPRAPQKGLGGKLVEAIETVETDVSEKTCKLLILEVCDNNEIAKSLYLGSGFVECGGQEGEGGRRWMERLIPT
jgi:hypothetical protein